MKKKFTFLSLLILMYFITSSSLYAQQRISIGEMLNYNNDWIDSTNYSMQISSFLEVTPICGGGISLEWDESNNPFYDYHTIYYLTACMDSDENITYYSNWISAEAPNNEAELPLSWGIPVPQDTPFYEFCSTLIPSDCESPIVIVVLAGTKGGIKPTYLYPISFPFPCLPCFHHGGLGIIASIEDLELINVPCLPTDPDCSPILGGKTSSTAYSPKDITLSTKPNPFHSQTTIEYTLTEESNVSLQIFDLQGRVIAQLLDQKQQTAGKQQQTWNAQQLPSGVYYYQLNVDGYTQTKKLVKF